MIGNIRTIWEAILSIKNTLSERGLETDLNISIFNKKIEEALNKKYNKKKLERAIIQELGYRQDWYDKYRDYKK